MKAWIEEEGRVRFTKTKSLFKWEPWTQRKVFAYQKKAEIEKRLQDVEDDRVGEEADGEGEEGGKKKARKNTNIGDRQKLITEMLKALTEDELEELDNSVKEWNNQRPPPDVQAKYVLHIRTAASC